MFPLDLPNKYFNILILSSCCSLLPFSPILTDTITPTFAHEVEVSGNVAATFHLEPNHNPKVGETAQVWFALTQKGGKIIPFSNCECELFIYHEPRANTDSPVLTPTLQGISAEKYQGIPGANVIFPETGRYQLELTGSPKNGANFNPFQFRYSVTVQ